MVLMMAPYYLRLIGWLVTLRGSATPLCVARAGMRPKDRNMNLMVLCCSWARPWLSSLASEALLTKILLEAVVLSLVR